MATLTWTEATRRAGLVRVDSYDIALDLSGAVDGGVFTATTTVWFDCHEPGAATFIDVKPAQLVSASLNGVPLDLADLVDERLALNGLAAANELVLTAQMSYSNTGEGLHRFVDPADGNVYLYAQSFLDAAPRIFACFDQPDLKAAYSLRVTAPTHWLVAANGLGAQSAPGHWEFAKTERLSTYLVSLVAGPYHLRRVEHDGIALGFYCRASLAPDLDKDLDELVGITSACFDRYHELFDFRYPFVKYDQAFVPEFNAGAMENAGLVTLRDDYLFHSAVTDAQRERRAMTIAHEMAHMWFGDLVTMAWWDDLWLNESFAEYMGFRIVSEVTRFKSAWAGFAVGRKGWGYAEDQRPSTHPVAPTEVADTDQALLNFDGISYAKGASVLRQLAAWIGDDAFFGGVRRHFREHAFGNATLADLLSALELESGRDLGYWARVWLRTPQVNTLSPRCALGADGRFAAVSVRQSAPAQYPTLRPHRIGIGVYSGGERISQVELDLDPVSDGGLTPVPELTNTLAGELLLLNDGDLTYAKVRLDPQAAADLPRLLPALRDPLARAVAWSAAMEAVRDALTPARSFIELCAAALPVETELAIVERVVTFATRQVLNRFVAPDHESTARACFVQGCVETMAAAAPGSGHQLAAAGGFVSAAGLPQVQTLLDWLAGGAPVGLAMDAEMRWQVLARLSALGALGVAEIDAQYQGDRSARGSEWAAYCRAALPDADAKARAWRLFMTEDGHSNRVLGVTAEGFWQPGQQSLTDAYVPRFFAEAPAMAQRRMQQVAIIVLMAGMPMLAVNDQAIALAEQVLAQPTLSPIMRRAMTDYADDQRRALAGRTLDGGGRVVDA